LASTSTLTKEVEEGSKTGWYNPWGNGITVWWESSSSQGGLCNGGIEGTHHAREPAVVMRVIYSSYNLLHNKLFNK